MVIRGLVLCSLRYSIYHQQHWSLTDCFPFSPLPLPHSLELELVAPVSLRAAAHTAGSTFPIYTGARQEKTFPELHYSSGITLKEVELFANLLRRIFIYFSFFYRQTFHFRQPTKATLLTRGKMWTLMLP